MPKATDEEREEYIKQRLMEQQPANDWKLDIVPETLILIGLLFAFLQPVMGVVLILLGIVLLLGADKLKREVAEDAVDAYLEEDNMKLVVSPYKNGCIYGVIALSITAATFYFLIMYLME